MIYVVYLWCSRDCSQYPIPYGYLISRSIRHYNGLLVKNKLPINIIKDFKLEESIKELKKLFGKNVCYAICKHRNKNQNKITFVG